MKRMLHSMVPCKYGMLYCSSCNEAFSCVSNSKSNIYMMHHLFQRHFKRKLLFRRTVSGTLKVQIRTLVVVIHSSSATLAPLSRHLLCYELHSVQTSLPGLDDAIMAGGEQDTVGAVQRSHVQDAVLVADGGCSIQRCVLLIIVR